MDEFEEDRDQACEKERESQLFFDGLAIDVQLCEIYFGFHSYHLDHADQWDQCFFDRSWCRDRVGRGRIRAPRLFERLGHGSIDRLGGLFFGW